MLTDIISSLNPFFYVQEIWKFRIFRSLKSYLVFMFFYFITLSILPLLLFNTVESEINSIISEIPNEMQLQVNLEPSTLEIKNTQTPMFIKINRDLFEKFFKVKQDLETKETREFYYLAIFLSKEEELNQLTNETLESSFLFVTPSNVHVRSSTGFQYYSVEQVINSPQTLGFLPIKNEKESVQEGTREENEEEGRSTTRVDAYDYTFSPFLFVTGVLGRSVQDYAIDNENTYSVESVKMAFDIHKNKIYLLVIFLYFVMASFTSFIVIAYDLVMIFLTSILISFPFRFFVTKNIGFKKILAVLILFQIPIHLLGFLGEEKLRIFARISIISFINYLATNDEQEIVESSTTSTTSSTSSTTTKKDS